MPRRGQSVPVPDGAGGAMLPLLRLPREPVSTCANSRAIPVTGERYACRSDALLFVTDAVPALGWSMGPF